MKLLSYQIDRSSPVEVGLINALGVVSLHRGLPAGLLAPHEGMCEVIARWDRIQPLLATWGEREADAALDAVHVLAPVPRPGKTLAIGLNYLDHVQERIVGESRTVPEHQVWFPKLANAIHAPFDDIVLPRVSDKTDYEAELVAVIGQRCKHVPRERAHEVVFGYAVGNDVSVRDWQKRTSQWTLGKSFDTHAPFGPCLTTADELGGDPHGLDMRCWVNGELRQHSNTRLMIHNVWDQIALISQAMTLEPGDVIFTGTCSGVGAAFEPPRFLRAGDVVRIEIDRLGAIEARCVDEA
ncbi:MAG TPA: fumarylacetoacetate hydrolase family protein [Aquabacterium sp.]|nr:fumarylacetoacetate hydrolase family protein [Aquabacterium sp.]HRH27679.1 fumarylacetoacetate hydrolase family protein [Aquabacterium sp.]